MTVYDDIEASHQFIGPLLNQALACLCEAVNTIPNPPQHCCFRVGTEAIHDAGYSVDQCCEGIAYVMMGDIYPSTESFPEQDIVRQANSNCSPAAFGIVLKMGIIRCIEVGGINPLDCPGWNAAALQNVYDAKALTRASCCLRTWVVTTSDLFIGMSAVIDRQVQGNPLGGCIERSMTMQIQYPNCDCP